MVGRGGGVPGGRARRPHVLHHVPAKHPGKVEIEQGQTANRRQAVMKEEKTKKN